MSQNLAINSNYDLYLAEDGNIAMNSGQDALLQACQTAAQAQLGEMVLSINTGVPNFQTIWQSATNIAQFEASLRRAILSVAGVIEIAELDTSVSNNTVFYRAVIRTIYGAGQITS